MRHLVGLITQRSMRQGFKILKDLRILKCAPSDRPTEEILSTDCLVITYGYDDKRTEIYKLSNTPYMAYCINVEIEDFRARKINLTAEAIEHIAKTHSEMSIDEITKVLQDPDEVRESAYNKPGANCLSELYYKLRTEAEDRYSVVVVKFCRDGNWVSTAYTGETLKKGNVVFRRE